MISKESNFRAANQSTGKNAKMLPPDAQKSDCRGTAVPHGSCLTDQNGEVLLQPVKQQQPTMDVGSQMSLC